MRDVVITVVCVAVLTPLLVLSAAAAGFSPRHWSGVPLSGVQFLFLESGSASSGDRSTALDEVTDSLIATDYRGWTSVYTGTGGLIHVETTRLEQSLFRDLGSSFGGDTVGLVYTPLTPPASPAGAADDGYTVETTWQRTDPVGTWVTLLIGFPWQLGTILLLTAVAWALVLRRRHSRRAADS